MKATRAVGLFAAGLLLLGCSSRQSAGDVRPLFRSESVPSLRVAVVSGSRKLERHAVAASDAYLLTPRGDSVSVFAARGETVAFQLVLRAEKPLHGLQVRTGARSENIVLRPFLELFLHAPSVSREMVALPEGDYPDPLVPFADPYGDSHAPVIPGFSVRPGKNTVLWIDISVSRGAQPGTHTASVQLLHAGKVILEIPVRVRVLGFTLPRQRHTLAWIPLYWVRLARSEGLDEDHFFNPENGPVLYRYYRMAYDHGFWTQVSDGVEQPRQRWNERTGELVSIDWARYDRFLEPVLSGRLFGGVRPAIWKVGGWLYWGARPGDPPNFGGDYQKDSRLTPAHRRALSRYVQEIVRHFERKGWGNIRLFMYLIDEPDYRSYPNLPRLIADYGETIRDASGGRIKHLVTVAPFLSALDDAGIDIYGVVAAEYWVPLFRRLQGQGKWGWFYQYHAPFVGGHCLDHEGLAFRTWAWIAHRYGTDGFLYWVANFWPEEQVYTSAKNWNDDEISNGILFYPGRRLPEVGFRPVAGPVPSFRLKAVRRGILDMEYFCLAHQIAPDRAERILRSVLHSALNEGQYNPYWKHPLWAKPGDWSHDPRDWETARRKWAEIILQRQSVKQEVRK